ncbi:transporter substrate-binding domain-containing protein [Rickettsiaceae bacterium]|nr:transporter substrate-binding domain-containing protein [Rickettsiaceae bacterium]
MKIIKFIFLLMALAITTSGTSYAHKDRKKLIIAGDYWCPYNCLPNSKSPGYAVELTREALDMYNIDVEYQMMPWYQATAMLKKGKIDGVIGVSDPNDAMLTTEFPFGYSVINAFTRSDSNWIYDGIDSLKNKKLGIIADYVVDEFIAHYFGIYYVRNPDKFVVEMGASAVAASVKNLINGKSDIYIEDKLVAEHYINKNNLSELIRNAGAVGYKKKPLYIAFSSNTPNIKQYIQYLEDGISSLKVTGEYDDLRAKYQMDK